MIETKPVQKTISADTHALMVATIYAAPDPNHRAPFIKLSEAISHTGMVIEKLGYKVV